MTEDTLKRANELKNEIKQLDSFMRDCYKCWRILRIVKPNRLKLKTAYGFIGNEIEVSKALADKILATMDEYKLELMAELERL